MISNTFKKYIWLINQFVKYGGLTFEEISFNYFDDGMSEDELPLRTFHQYRKGVEELFGVKIVCDPSKKYEYHAEGLDKLDNIASKWLIQTYGLAGDIASLHLHHDKILLEEFPHGLGFLKQIIEAIKQKKTLRVDYEAFGKSNTTYHIQPYCMKVYNRRWYVLGYLKEQEALRHISLDRIIDMEVTNDTFEIPADFDAKKYYANSVGIYVDENLQPQKVRFRVYGVQREYLRLLPIHKSQEEQFSNQEYSEFTLRVCLTPELSTTILSMGESVEVLEPQELREEIKRRLTESLTKYQ